jgi:hypothetical protein
MGVASLQHHSCLMATSCFLMGTTNPLHLSMSFHIHSTSVLYIIAGCYASDVILCVHGVAREPLSHPDKLGLQCLFQLKTCVNQPAIVSAIIIHNTIAGQTTHISYRGFRSLTRLIRIAGDHSRGAGIGYASRGETTRRSVRSIWLLIAVL